MNRPRKSGLLMATKTFTSIAAIENVIEAAADIAIQKVAKIVRDKLEEYIQEDFYSLYSPLFYTRTFSFLKSPKYNMLNKSSAEVFVDTDVMHYLGISGEDVATLASYGFHGSSDIFRPGFFWSDFISWADENIPFLLKLELIKQGIPVI